MSELRWNPLLGEWVATATHRQNRTYKPLADFCPLCPTTPGGFETEIPAETFEIAVFENRFPSLRPAPEEPAVEGTELMPVQPARGVCEIVVYTPDHTASLSTEPVEKLHDLVRVWVDRFDALGRLSFVRYVLIFENRGEEAGVTLSHPHDQIYGYPFVPPVIQRELVRAREHADRTGRCLVCDVLDEERRKERRVVAENASFTAYVPFFARWPYELHVTPRRHLEALTDLTPEECRNLASILKGVLVAYDRLFNKPFPYVMSIHQRPTDGQPYDYYHLHFEFYPPFRSEGRLKYLAGSELAGGMFVNDTLAEEKAAELRRLVPELARRERVR